MISFPPDDDSLVYVLHDGTADIIGNILAITNGGSLENNIDWALNTRYFITPILTSFDQSNNSFDFNAPCFIQGPASSVSWTNAYDFSLNIDTLVCEGGLVEILPVYNGTYPLSIELTEQNFGQTNTYILDSHDETFFLDGSASSNWTVTDVGSECIENFEGNIQISVQSIVIPEFEICYYL